MANIAKEDIDGRRKQSQAQGKSQLDDNDDGQKQPCCTINRQLVAIDDDETQKNGAGNGGVKETGEHGRYR